MKISRRDFLGTAAVTGTAALAATDALPTRILGRTGARVSILAMGGAVSYTHLDVYKRQRRQIGRAHV